MDVLKASKFLGCEAYIRIVKYDRILRHKYITCEFIHVVLKAPLHLTQAMPFPQKKHRCVGLE